VVTRFEKTVHIVTVASIVLLVTASSAFRTSDRGDQTNPRKRVGVLHDNELKKPERAAGRREQLAMVIAERFSCTDMARHVLGHQWTLLGQEERDDFVHLFRLLLLKTYAYHIGRYADQYVEYLEERMDHGRALVRTKVITHDRQLLLEFWLFEGYGDWKVYDVVVDGVSLIQSYRGQFTRALRISSFADLLERMREKACLPDCDVQTARGPSR
jgi:phospholipid transport system substrate-binding protein